MPKEEFDPEDPMEMVAVELPGQSEEQLKEMALCFAEEFIRDGWDEEKLFTVFQNPFYQGPYLVWKQKGDDFVQSVIREAMTIWRQMKPRLTEPFGFAQGKLRERKSAG